MKADTYIQMAVVKFEMDRHLRAAEEQRLVRLAPRHRRLMIRHLHHICPVRGFHSNARLTIGSRALHTIGLKTQPRGWRRKGR